MPANKKSHPTFKVLPLVGIELPGIFFRRLAIGYFHSSGGFIMHISLSRSI